MPRFLKELPRSTGLALGRMDARYSVDAAFRHYVGTDLGVDMPFTYRTRNEDVIRKWSYRTVPDGQFYEPSYVKVGPRLGRVMRRNPALRVFVGSGYYDFATPFFDAELTFAPYGIVRERVTMASYESGHMLYVHEPTRQRLLDDVRSFVRGGAASTRSVDHR